MTAQNLLDFSEEIDRPNPVWWNLSWSKCRNISIETKLIRNNAIMEVNLTNLVFKNITEVRIVNNYCYNGGNEVKSTVLRNGSDWAYTTFLANLSGSNTAYSVYYDNPNNPNKSLKLIDDFCEFENDICGWVNLTAYTQNYSVHDGLFNLTRGGIYSPKVIGVKNLYTRYSSASGISSNRPAGAMLTEATSKWPTQGNYSYGSYIDPRPRTSNHELFVYFGNGQDQWVYPNIYETGYYNIWMQMYIKVNTSYIVNISSYNATGQRDYSNVFTNFSDGGVNVSGGKGTMFMSIVSQNGNYDNVYYTDFIRAYDIEAEFVGEHEMPSFIIGDEEEKPNMPQIHS